MNENNDLEGKTFTKAFRVGSMCIHGNFLNLYIHGNRENVFSVAWNMTHGLTPHCQFQDDQY